MNIQIGFDDLPAMANHDYRFLLRLPSDLTNCVVRVEATYLKNGVYRNAGSVSVNVR